MSYSLNQLFLRIHHFVVARHLHKIVPHKTGTYDDIEDYILGKKCSFEKKNVTSAACA